MKVFRLGESQHCGKFWSLKPAFHSGNSPLCAGKVVLSDYSQKHCKIKTNQLEISYPNQSMNLSQWFCNSKNHQNYLKGSLKTQNGGGEVSLHQAIWFNICGMEPIPNKLPGCADAAGLGDLLLRTPRSILLSSTLHFFSSLLALASDTTLLVSFCAMSFWCLQCWPCLRGHFIT